MLYDQGEVCDSWRAGRYTCCAHVNLIFFNDQLAHGQRDPGTFTVISEGAAIGRKDLPLGLSNLLRKPVRTVMVLV